jgi:hypothetical protein
MDGKWRNNNKNKTKKRHTHTREPMMEVKERGKV